MAFHRTVYARQSRSTAESATPLLLLLLLGDEMVTAFASSVRRDDKGSSLRTRFRCGKSPCVRFELSFMHWRHQRVERGYERSHSDCISVRGISGHRQAKRREGLDDSIHIYLRSCPTCAMLTPRRSMMGEWSSLLAHALFEQQSAESHHSSTIHSHMHSSHQPVFSLSSLLSAGADFVPKSMFSLVNYPAIHRNCMNTGVKHASRHHTC